MENSGGAKLKETESRSENRSIMTSRSLVNGKKELAEATGFFVFSVL